MQAPRWDVPTACATSVNTRRPAYPPQVVTAGMHAARQAVSSSWISMLRRRHRSVRAEAAGEGTAYLPAPFTVRRASTAPDLLC